MKNLLAAFALSFAAATAPAIASPLTADQVLTATSDASIATCSGCPPLNLPFLIAGMSHQGVIKFDTSKFGGSVDGAKLALTTSNIWQAVWVDIYGYGSDTSVISGSEVNAGTFIGRINIPWGIAADETLALDVSDFVRHVSSPFAAFNLRSIGLPGSANFYSVRSTSGTAPQLLLDLGPAIPSDVPEPGQLALVLLALAALGSARRAQQR